MALLLFLSTLIISVGCKIHFHEKVDNDFHSRWVRSTSSSVSKHGELVVVESDFEENDFFVKTSEDSSHYQYGAQFAEPLDTSEKDLILQYVVLHNQSLDCGGAYLKLYNPDTDFKTLDGDTPYWIMFGPDHCGYSTSKVHFIVNVAGKNHEITQTIPAQLDKKGHLYTLILYSNKTFVILVDDEHKRNGSLAESFTILPPKVISDPTDKRPDDWVTESSIPDPTDKKPADWMDVATIVDPDATKPDDWNDETDGEWQPDSIPNPDYKGEWQPKTIENPTYKGEWEPKKISNPDFKEDLTIGNFIVGGVGLEIWQVKSGTHFDEIFVTDDVDESKQHALTVMERLNKISTEVEKREEAERQKLSEERKSEKKVVDAENDDDDDEPDSLLEESKGLEDDDHKSEL